MNPYSSPAAQAPGAAATPVSGGWLKWAHLATLVVPLILAVIGMIIAAITEQAGAEPSPIPGLIMMIGFPVYMLRFVFALMWVHAAWSTLPPHRRMTRAGRM